MTKTVKVKLAAGAGGWGWGFRIDAVVLPNKRKEQNACSVVIGHREWHKNELKALVKRCVQHLSRRVGGRPMGVKCVMRMKCQQ